MLDALKNKRFKKVCRSRKTERGKTMCSILTKKRLLFLLTMYMVFCATATADMLELLDGTIITGNFMGGTQNTVRFQVDVRSAFGFGIDCAGKHRIERYEFPEGFCYLVEGRLES